MSVLTVLVTVLYVCLCVTGGPPACHCRWPCASVTCDRMLNRPVTSTGNILDHYTNDERCNCQIHDKEMKMYLNSNLTLTNILIVAIEIFVL